MTAAASRPRAGRARRVAIRTFADGRGRLSVVEEGTDLPFTPRRLYYLYGNAGAALRGVHAHKTLRQFLVVLAGSADVVVDNGAGRETFHLDDPGHGLLLEPVIWREIHDMSPDAIVAVLVSDVFSTDDYIYEYDAFLDYLEG